MHWKDINKTKQKQTKQMKEHNEDDILIYDLIIQAWATIRQNMV